MATTGFLLPQAGSLPSSPPSTTRSTSSHTYRPKRRRYRASHRKSSPSSTPRAAAQQPQHRHSQPALAFHRSLRSLYSSPKHAQPSDSLASSRSTPGCARSSRDRSLVQILSCTALLCCKPAATSPTKPSRTFRCLLTRASFLSQLFPLSTEVTPRRRASTSGHIVAGSAACRATSCD